MLEWFGALQGKPDLRDTAELFLLRFYDFRLFPVPRNALVSFARMEALQHAFGEGCA